MSCSQSLKYTPWAVKDGASFICTIALLNVDRSDVIILSLLHSGIK